VGDETVEKPGLQAKFSFLLKVEISRKKNKMVVSGAETQYEQFSGYILSSQLKYMATFTIQQIRKATYSNRVFLQPRYAAGGLKCIQIS
jgi:hypothetical protein